MEYGTNMHAGFMLARQLLARHKGGNKQIIMITDGEPTAHMEGSEARVRLPADPADAPGDAEGSRSAARASGITINTFMLERSHDADAFVDQMTRINRGRAFFATPERLGEYILVDYVRSKKRFVA